MESRTNSPGNVTSVAAGYVSFVVDLSERHHHQPILPDGLVLIVKKECETCRMIAPLLGEFDATVYTQDDPTFPEGAHPIFDADLAVSWHHSIDTVPTLIRVVDGGEVERTVGWLRSDWQRITGISTLGDDLPVMRPGCGSMSVDPNLVDSLRAKFGSGVLRSRRLELADLDDEMEVLFDR
ncbi:MAG: thioredoxin family protein, partial [Ilumatobacteraceae bacterium]